MIDYTIFSKELLFMLRSTYYDMLWECLDKEKVEEAKYLTEQLENVENEILDRNLWNEYLEYIRK